MEGKRFVGAILQQADFSGAYLKDCDFTGADLRHAVLLHCTLAGARLDGAEVNLTTFRDSEWAPEEFAALHARHRFRIVSLDAFPAEVQRLILRDVGGLTLFLSTHLLPWDQTMLHAFACSVLGMDTDVRVAEYTETGEDSCRVRMVGSNQDDLDRVAQHLAEVTWKTEQKHALQEVGLLQIDAVRTSLDHIR